MSTQLHPVTKKILSLFQYFKWPHSVEGTEEGKEGDLRMLLLIERSAFWKRNKGDVAFRRDPYF
jgi:hypothetical protein